MIFDSRFRRNLDLTLIVITYVIAFFGVLVLWSATRGEGSHFERKQIVGIFLGTIAMIGMAKLDYHHLARFAKNIYLFNLILLLIVRFKGHDTNGSTRWIKIASFQFQPSEFAKLAAIITLATFIVQRQETIREFKTVGLSLLYIAVPAFLILKQPDLGTALVVFAIWFGMLFMAGAQLKHLTSFFAMGAVIFCVGWQLGAVNDYQKNRLLAFWDSTADPKGAGYHVKQARIAIGSGGVWGKGLAQSTQVRGGYIPEKQSDFVFTTVGEEFGFVGSIGLLAFYGGLLYRAVAIAASAEEDHFGQLLASGVICMLGFHIIENVGMNVGILPVAGVPLPMISAGNSNMIVTLASIGLLLSVLRHRHQLLFRG